MSRFEVSVTDPSTGQGRIRLGDFEEAIQVDVEGAPLEWYLGQWRFSLSRLVEDQVEAVIVVCVPAQSSGHPSTGSVPIEAPGEDWEPVEGCGEAWTFTVGDDGRVHVHNVLLFPDLTIIDGFQVVRLEPTTTNRATMTTRSTSLLNGSSISLMSRSSSLVPAANRSRRCYTL